MQINAQSASSFMYMQTEQAKKQTQSPANQVSMAATQDSVTLSSASLALANGKGTQPEAVTYGWPVWPSTSNQSGTSSE